jgi:ATP-dependent metallopeptidase hflB
MYVYAKNASQQHTATKSEFENLLNSQDLSIVYIKQNQEIPSGSATLVDANGKEMLSNYYVSDINELIAQLNAKNIDYSLSDVERSNNMLSTWIPIILTIGIFLFVLFFIQSRMGGANSKMMDFGKSRARRAVNVNVDFSKVAGLKEEKEDLEEVVDFLKSPGKYAKLGARIPKGILLVGRPGTGKTLLAKAVAGEAGVPFFSISGSDFVEMFVGVGASRVRDLFNDAKRNAPCIVFIDEIDAVARQRGSGLGGSHDEREQTLNQLLVEMDGFGLYSGIIVLAATNRPDILDPAILRPGRFDRKIVVSPPDVKGREEILKVHAKDKPMSDDVDLVEIAKTTSGFTGADLENLLNEAAILAAKSGKKYISNDDIKQSFIKVGIGTEKKSKVVSDKERKITAYHEAGHAILFRELPDVGPVHTISIIPTGMGAAGYTMPLPEEDYMFNTKSKMLNEIKVSLGGRIAEELIFGDVTTGASGDIKQATKLAKAMVMKYGMSDKLGMINYESEHEEIFIGRDIGHTKTYADDTARIIDEEIRNIIDSCYEEAKQIIMSRRNVLDKCCELLLEKEKIGYEEFEALFND